MKELEELKSNPNNEFTKKEILKISNQYEKLVRSLNGISEMQKAPDLVFIIFRINFEINFFIRCIDCFFNK